jgi:hypothetical protein
LVEIGGETYLDAKSSANYVGVSRGVFYANVKPLLEKHKPKASKRWLYRLADLDKFRGLQTVAEPIAS